MTDRSWFARLFGFDESAVDDVAARFHLDGQTLTAVANGRRLAAGRPAQNADHPPS